MSLGGDLSSWDDRDDDYSTPKESSVVQKIRDAKTTASGAHQNLDFIYKHLRAGGAFTPMMQKKMESVLDDIQHIQFALD